MFRKLVQVAIFLLVANAVYRIAPVTVHYLQFKDALKELALFATPKQTEAELVERVMALADENSIPLERDGVLVRRLNGQLTIDASYVCLDMTTSGSSTWKRKRSPRQPFASQGTRARRARPPARSRLRRPTGLLPSGPRR